MKNYVWSRLFLIAACFAPPFIAHTQTHMTTGLNLGLQTYPSRSQATPMIGASTWLSAGEKFRFSAEYLFHNGVEQYARSMEDALVTISSDRSKTHRVAVGVHYPIMVHGRSSVTLLGLNFGQSWDRFEYRYFDVSNVPIASYIGEHENVRRSVLYASWTVMSQNRKIPFSLQARYGYSFGQASPFVLKYSKSLLQVVAGLHLGIF